MPIRKKKATSKIETIIFLLFGFIVDQKFEIKNVYIIINFNPFYMTR